MKRDQVLRIIDANFNRLREALRVCEEVTRFVIEDREATAKLKNIRHQVQRALAGSKGLRYPSLVSARDSKNDVGKYTTLRELKRDGPFDVLSANLQRAKESVRVLEEFLKIIDRKAALQFKEIRFKVYNIEKVLIERVESSNNPG